MLMGWFSSGPTVKERNRAGRIEYYGNCEKCGKEKADFKKSDVEYELKKCARRDNEEAEKAEKKRVKAKREQEERDERDRKRREEAEARDAEKQREKQLRKEAERVRAMMIKGRNEKRREAKGKKCPFCGHMPCKGTKPKCAAVIAAGFESIMNTGDPSDPATFDAQLKFYRDNM
jgi:flagellar biosynthesis GTPase FlhF